MKKLALLLLTWCLSAAAFAGPGGKIASALFDTFWGKVLLGALTIILLPLIIWSMVQHHLAARRARQDLRFLAQHHAAFDWSLLETRVRTCFLQVHRGWENEDLCDVSEWMSDWYWQNQQLTHLDRWRKQGLQNVCEVKKITSLRPLLFAHRNQASAHEGSTLSVMISAKMIDYLQKRSDGTLVEGSKKSKEVETIWQFTLIDGKWKVSDIRDGSESLAIASLRHEFPSIQSYRGSRNAQ
jgi:hypothetical protein